MTEDKGMRLNKYLAAAGVCSRRRADAAIEAGEVSVDGRRASLGQQVFPGQEVIFRGVRVEPEEEEILLVVNKPIGIVCTAEKREKDNIVDYIGYGSRIYPIGRLDKDSRGLILMTNQGQLADEIMRAGRGHEKEYIVETSREINGLFLSKLRDGVYLKELDLTTRPCKTAYIGPRCFSIVLQEGKNRQIRRMCDALGYRVTDLKRIRVMNISLGNLAEGDYRPATKKEINGLWEEIKRTRSRS